MKISHNPLHSNGISIWDLFSHLKHFYKIRITIYFYNQLLYLIITYILPSMF